MTWITHETIGQYWTMGTFKDIGAARGELGIFELATIDT
jgi:hypothetical protein